MRSMCRMPCAGFRFGAQRGVTGRIDSVGWGLFLLWVGVAFLLDLGWGIGLLGIGVLILTMQIIRHGLGSRLVGFWILVGGAFTLVGIWKLAAIDVSLGPILLIGCGFVVLASALRRKRG